VVNAEQPENQQNPRAPEIPRNAEDKSYIYLVARICSLLCGRIGVHYVINVKRCKTAYIIFEKKIDKNYNNI
jgi:hypothetical protein